MEYLGSSDRELCDHSNKENDTFLKKWFGGYMANIFVVEEQHWRSLGCTF